MVDHLFLWEVFGIFDITLLYSAEQRLVVLQYQLQVDVHIRSRLTSYAKFVGGSLKSIRRPREKKALDQECPREQYTASLGML
ncbi:hypothetical protein DPMN_049883 [Dreissena polymorpha]|uniref:Uncharacterized protein n=1 Tax=Dreissena polymorpha TaxID=45954 RepID=A0A9D4CG66_DREPO|nr:hypothetical protein DPMN_049883 [Dreissena polymorpha]